MSFAPNPLSLSVPEPAFESWLRDSGYLEVLDHRTTQLHNLHSSAPSTTSSHTSTAAPTTSPSNITTGRPSPTTTLTSVAYTLTLSLISSLATFLSIFTLNPFSKLTTSDFASNNSNSFNWTKAGFWGSFDTYSFPSSPTQAKMRVHENVKRFARNYAVLAALIFACSLYQMPLALIGLLSCLAVWELFRFCDTKWALNRYPSSRQVLIRIAQCAVAAILFWSNVQMAVFCTLAVSYAVLMLHAAFRKLTPAKPLPKGRGR